MMKIFRVALIGVLLLLVCTSGIESQAPSQGDACTLLPGSPAEVYRIPSTAICSGLYWQRVGKSHFRDLGEFGVTVAIESTASAAAARQKLTTLRTSGLRQASLGDGGFEKLENPSGNDEPTPTPEEVRDNTHYRSIEDLLTFDGYSAFFTCGPFAVYVHANPSKGPAARQLVAELDSKFRDAKVCATASAPPAVIAAADPPAPPPVTDETPRTGGTRHFEGNTAREILAAHEFGSRYMVVLSREWDASRGCWVEERAWAGGVRASAGGDRVTVTMGPSKTFCVTGNVVSAAQVNESHRIIYSAQDNLAKALKRQDDLDPYLKDPNTRAWATNELKTVQQWIEYYKKIISATEAGLASSVP